MGVWPLMRRSGAERRASAMISIGTSVFTQDLTSHWLRRVIMLLPISGGALPAVRTKSSFEQNPNHFDAVEWAPSTVFEVVDMTGRISDVRFTPKSGH